MENSVRIAFYIEKSFVEANRYIKKFIDGDYPEGVTVETVGWNYRITVASTRDKIYPDGKGAWDKTCRLAVTPCIGVRFVPNDHNNRWTEIAYAIDAARTKYAMRKIHVLHRQGL